MAAPGQRTCPRCGAVVPSEFRFCGRCGTDLEAVADSLPQSRRDASLELPWIARVVGPQQPV